MKRLILLKIKRIAPSERIVIARTPKAKSIFNLRLVDLIVSAGSI